MATMSQGRVRLVAAVALSIALLLLTYLAMLAGGTSHVAIWLNDVMAILAGTYRVQQGQIPSIDFSSAYGAAIYYPTALGLSLDQAPGVALAFGQLCIGALLLVVALPSALARVQLMPALLFGAVLFLLTVVPIPLGKMPNEHTFGTFYNRHGWAWLAVVLLFYLEPRNPRSGRAFVDSLMLALALLFLFYNKINYAIVGLAAVPLIGLVSAYNRRVALLAVGAVVAVLVTVEVLHGYNSAYLGDIRYLSEINADKLRPSNLLERPWEIASAVHVSAQLLAACLASYVILLLMGRRCVVDAAFVGLAMVGCLLLTVQTYTAIAEAIGLISVLLTLGELVRRQEVDGSGKLGDLAWRHRAGSVACFALLLIMLVPVIAGRAYGLYNYRQETTADITADTTRSDFSEAGVRVGPSYSTTLHAALGHSPDAHDKLTQMRRDGLQFELNAMEYASLIQEGLSLLRRHVQPDSTLFVFDMTDPFTSLLKLRPTRYGYPMFWAEASFSRTTHPSPARLIGDADFVVVPIVPYSQGQLEEMKAVYGAHLEAEYAKVTQSEHWVLWERRVVEGSGA